MGVARARISMYDSNMFVSLLVECHIFAKGTPKSSQSDARQESE